ncbi:MAG: ABC transporter substrate-binding protein [Anaerolineales bacterium]|nr:ABC transporter substrate-binding protein [Anaerolineales bacterium]
MDKNFVTKEEMAEVHPMIPEVYEQLKQGRISRREFLRTSTLLGMSIGVASIAAACGGGAAPAAEEPAAEEPAAEEPAAEAPAEEAVAEAPAEEAMDTGGIKRGGTLRVGSAIPAVDHPARFSWIFDANEFRHVFEYLTETDKDNVTHPYLLESWTANEDLTVWDLKLREGIMWTNGEELVADHVVFNFNEWLNPDVGSSILGLWEGFLTPDGIEVVDQYTVRLNLAQPLLAVPENLFHYPAQIIHPSFDGDITSGANASTGPYTLKEYVIGERVRLESRAANGDAGYWQKGADGNPLPYLDAIEFVDLGEDSTAYVAALLSGEIGNIYRPGVDGFLALRDQENVVVNSVGTGATVVMRFRVDLEPWTDVRVRNAVKKVQDRQRILDQAYFGEGLLGYDTHASPVHPEWAPMDLPEYDPDGARALLDEAGIDQLNFAVSVGTGWPDIVAYAETLKEDAKAAGINIDLDTMPNSAYWDLWTETPVGITTWAHRPLAVMLLPLAYIADAEGNPVPWNESRWVDEEFSELLKQAQGTLDVEARRALMADIQRIQQERGSVGVAFFQNLWAASNPAYVGIEAHPTDYNLWREVWYNPDADPFA